MGIGKNIIQAWESNIEYDWVLVNGMVHLPQEWNVGTTKILPSPATQLSHLIATPEAYMTSRIEYTYV